MSHVVVIPVSFETSDQAPIALAIELARSTKPLHIVVVCDRKGRSLRAAEAALQNHEGDDIELVVVSAKDTGFRWGMGLDATMRILKDRKIDSELLLCLPGDPDPEEFTPAHKLEFQDRLKELLTEAESHDLTIGDYSIPKDPVKEAWDKFQTLPYIGALHPELAIEFAELPISKLRSEFFCLKLARLGSWIEPTDFPSDPTPFMINAVLRNGGSIGVTGLGGFADEDPGRTGVVAKAYQAVRLALEMAVTHAANERNEARRRDETLEQQLDRTRLLRERLSALIEALLGGIRAIETHVATPAEPNAKLRDGGWAPVRGLTCLFETIESTYETFGPGIERLRTKCDGLLDRLGGVAEALGRALRHHGVVWLPAHTYHVTYRDIVCDLDLPDLSPEHAREIGALLKRLPDDFRSVAQALSPLPVAKEIEPVTFRADELAIWGGNALVLKLTAADPESEGRFKALCRQRESENAAWSERYGLCIRSGFQPHVSLGYFSDLAQGHAVEGNDEEGNAELLETCRSIARETVGDATLTVERWSLHGFLDMATFFKLA